MITATEPFPLPRELPPMLARIHQYWKSLIRAENPMPFSDDMNLGPIEKLSADLMLVDVFSEPERFRFNRLGENIVRKLNYDLTGQFADVIKPAEPLNYFIAQASATIEAGTHRRCIPLPEGSREKGAILASSSGVGQWSHRSAIGCGYLTASDFGAQKPLFRLFKFRWID